MGGFASRDAVWEQAIHGGPPGHTPLPPTYGSRVTTSGAQWVRGGDGKAHPAAVADPATSGVHRYFAWHVVVVFGGFVAVRAAWIWLDLNRGDPAAAAARRRPRDAAVPHDFGAEEEAAPAPRRRPSRDATAPPSDNSSSDERRALPHRPRSSDGAVRVRSSPLRRRDQPALGSPKRGGGAPAAAGEDGRVPSNLNSPLRRRGSRQHSNPIIGGDHPPGPFGQLETPHVHPFDDATATVSSGKWVTIRALGHGSFGTVTLVRNADTGVYAALKQVPQGGEAGQLTREFSLLCDLKPHPHVVRVLGAAVRGHRARLFLEYCPNGSLADVLKRGIPQPEPFVRSCIRQILEGLAYLHHHNILHRDIKPANILVDSHGALKIADFGLSRHLDSLKTHTVQAGSPAYMSPESIRGQLSSGSDLWSVAATMCEMLSGQLPWAHHAAFRAGKEPLLLYIGTHPEDHPEIPAHASAEARDLLQVLFRSDPKARGTAAVALLHPFFAMEAPTTPSCSHTSTLVGSLGGASEMRAVGPQRGGGNGLGSLGRQHSAGHTFGPPCSMEVTSDASPTPPPPLAGVSGIVGGSTLHTDPDVSF